MDRRKHGKMAAPALPKQFLPTFDVADVELVEDKQVYTVRASFGDITSCGKGFHMKTAKRAAVRAIVECGLARLRNKRMVENSGLLYTSFERGTPGADLTKVSETIDLTIGSPKPEKDDLKEVIGLSKGECKDLTIGAPKLEKDDLQEVIDLSKDDCKDLTIGAPKLEKDDLEEVLDLSNDACEDLTFGSPQPEKDELKEVLDLSKHDCEDLTIELPKEDKDRFKELIKVSNNDCHDLTIDLPRQTCATMNKLIDEPKELFHEFTEDFSRPADFDPKESMEVNDDETIDETNDETNDLHVPMDFETYDVVYW